MNIRMRFTAVLLAIAMYAQLIPANAKNLFSSKKEVSLPVTATAEQELSKTTEDAYILGKIISERDAYTKRFQMSDGTFRLFTGASCYTKCIDGQPGDSTDTNDQSSIKQAVFVEGNSGQKWYFFTPVKSSDKVLKSPAAYTEDGNFLVSVTDNSGNTSYTQYDPASGQLLSSTDANGN